ncbi:MAG: DNA mismatch repair endonuclease MutL [Prevotellaceae bacterium]|jgi:DNA mismatch repair protein MutL|nr:DNA mismatch repair endonuclease MutL [Prevotellaceae bacterium]
MIQLLPDHIANQIAAGEVVQRPASALKELLENAVDAGATAITVALTDAGRTLLQVVDNGCGMNAADARMAFERHATSKIVRMDDLNAISTFGFRGEALASIAAVADVELKTRRADDEAGTYIRISASEVTAQEAAACAEGTSVAVRNLFFNVPARRRFLKSDSVELKHIVMELQRVALCYPAISFRLLHNSNELYNLPATHLRQRILSLMGKDINQRLIDVMVDTAVVQIKGFVGKPASAKRTAGDQYFFVNNRFFRSPYFQKAIFNAYQQLLPPDRAYPSFFIYFELPPDRIDVNIHPAKIEIKFEDEQVIFQILHAAVREALGKFAVVPSIDFDTEGAPAIPVIRKNDPPATPPQVRIDPFFNPFEEEKKTAAFRQAANKPPVKNWQRLYDGLTQNTDFDPDAPAGASLPDSPEPESLPINYAPPERPLMQLRGKYLLTPIKSGLMLIDCRRAQQRILYERFLHNLTTSVQETQKEIFPQTVTLSPVDYALLETVADDLKQIGYDIRPFGNNTVVVNGQPASAPAIDAAQWIEELLAALHENPDDLKRQRQEKLAVSLAKAAAGNSHESLTSFEAQALIDNLFACREPSLSPEGKPTLQIISIEEIDRRFLK